MTGRGHKLFGLGLATASAACLSPFIGGEAALALVAGSYPGTTAPDWMEVRIGGFRLIPHRTITHWLLLWVALGAVGVWLMQSSLLPGALLTGFALGGFSHWLGDFGTPMGVPVLHPTRRKTLGLWGTGKGEYKPILLAWALAAACVLLVVR